MKKAPFWRRLVENLNSKSIAQDEGFVKGMKEVRIGMAGGVGFKRRNPRNDRGYGWSCGSGWSSGTGWPCAGESGDHTEV
jgi:hypothetical protein